MHAQQQQLTAQIKATLMSVGNVPARFRILIAVGNAGMCLKPVL